VQLKSVDKQLEDKVLQYENILKSAVDCFNQIKELNREENNDSSLEVEKRITMATINFKNAIEQQNK
jgi:hypothetical protein